MSKTLLIFLSLMAISLSSYAAKVYKIVDEDGKVTFSHVPPQEDNPDSELKVEELAVSGGGKTSITTEFGQDYCGEIRLPQKSNSTRSSSSKYFMQNISRSLENWERDLDKLTKNLESQSRRNNSQRHDSYYNSQNKSAYQERRSQSESRIRDLRCAIAWSESKQKQIATFEAEDTVERARLLEISDNLKLHIKTQCGDLPKYDPMDQTNERRRKDWYNCSKPTMDEINRVKRRLNAL
ncbi:DUF4124 domain-containing protein [Agaribacterium sp. ZY112]|uniref:DUF4124 domain-containing protein n=1 Tax=Agaribacterium sp. ZY112 TaxID=3233574 RepID=UPI0035250492